jgi:triacylglycerol lipase
MTVVAGFTSSVLAGFTSSPADDPKLVGGLTRSRARSLVECAVLAYKSRPEVEAALGLNEAKGQLRFEWFEAAGRSFDSQGFACVVGDHVILAFRGTKELRDFLTDALRVKRRLKDFNGSDSNDLGQVHLGFQRALNALWSDKRSARQNSLFPPIGPPIDRFLTEVASENPNSQLWLTGHSLGAALATIAAARVQLTEGAPFQGRIGALLTVGSPRVLDHQGADRLRQALGPDKIFRIHRSIDPVPAVPYWGFRHVSGPKAFVSNRGSLVMEVGKRRRWAERSAAFLLAMEDSVGSALPGRHRGYGKFVSDHDSEGYLAAVEKYSTADKVRVRDNVGPIAVPLAKLLGFGTVGWAAADSTGVTGLAIEAAAATARLFQTGAEAMLALFF